MADGAAGPPADTVTVAADLPAGRWISWDVTAIVRHQLANPRENFGILLRETAASAQAAGVLQFLSSQAFKSQPGLYDSHPRLARRPLLVVLP